MSRVHIPTPREFQLVPSKVKDSFADLAYRLYNKGLAKYEPATKELQIEEQAANEFSYLLQDYYLKLIARNTGIPELVNYASQDIIYYIPLDEAYVPPAGLMANEIAQRWELERYWDLLTISATVTFLSSVLKATAGATMASVKVRPLLPAELGGAYAGGAVGPVTSAISGTDLRTLGTVGITLNEGVNTNVINMQTNIANSLQSVVFIIHKIRDTTIPQNAVGFAFTKNGKPYPPLDYSQLQPWIFVPWARNSYRYTVIGLLAPFFIPYNQSLQATVYSIATATESLFFEGFTAYIGPS